MPATIGPTPVVQETMNPMTSFRALRAFPSKQNMFKLTHVVFAANSEGDAFPPMAESNTRDPSTRVPRWPGR